MGLNRVKKEWNKAAAAWADFVRTGKDWTRNDLNNPAMLAMLGNLRGKRVLDLGCGEGFNARLMARRGARVVGVDFSEKIVRLAAEEEKRRPEGITYHRLNAEHLQGLKRGTFDIVACFMALQDIRNYRAAIGEGGRVLKKGGRFVFAIPHPCFEMRVIRGKRIGGWVYSREPGVKDKETALNQKVRTQPLYYTADHYFDNRPDTVVWDAKRLARKFRTTAFHRSLTAYGRALNRTGFVISRIDEPRPTGRGLRNHPDYFKGNLRIPHSIIIEAVKC